MAVTVLFQGRKKTVRLRPMDPMQRALEQAAQEFSVDPSAYTLVHKKTMIDLAQPFRFTNLSNNTTLELVQSQRSPSAAMPVRVGVVLPSGSSVAITVCDALSLSDMLSVLASEGHVSADELSGCELVYFRQSFSGDGLANTTLQSLGLGGSSAKFRLRTVAAPEAAEGTVEEKATAPADTEVHEPQAQAAPTECLAQRDETTSSDDSLLKNPHMGHGDEHVVDAPEQSLDARSVPMSVEPETQASTHETQPHVVPGIEGCRGAIEQLLSSHFTSDARDTVFILMRYLSYIISDPSSEKYRTLRYSNAVLSQRVLPRAGALAFLQSLGFTESHGNALSHEIARNPAEHTFLVLDWAAHSSTHTQEQLMQLVEDAYKLCEAACDELEVPREDRPTPKLRPHAPPQTLEFDPYRSTIFRASATAETVVRPVQEQEQTSITEQRLQELRARKQQLEGDVSAVQQNRDLQVSLGPVLRTATSIPVEKQVTAERKVDDETERRLYTRYLAKSIGRTKAQAEAPLKTRAVRELERIERQKAYAHTVLRLQLPDRSNISARFHPSETLSDVRELLRGCLSEDVTVDALRFYTSPPKTFLVDERSLDVMGLVPAAVVYVTVAQKLPDGASYLNESTRILAEQQSAAPSSAIVDYPAGLSVDQSREGKPVAELGLEISAASSTPGESKQTTAKKPKWLKI